jgi:hypothetical protein
VISDYRSLAIDKLIHICRILYNLRSLHIRSLAIAKLIHVYRILFNLRSLHIRSLGIDKLIHVYRSIAKDRMCSDLRLYSIR